MFGLWSLASGCIPRPRSCQRFPSGRASMAFLATWYLTTAPEEIICHTESYNYKSQVILVADDIRSQRWQHVLVQDEFLALCDAQFFSFAFLLNLCHSCHVDRWQGLAASILRRHSRRHPVSWKSISRRIHSLIGRPRSACTSDLECSDLIRSQQLVWGAAWCRHCKIMSLFDLLRLEQSYIQGKGEGQIRIPCWSCCREWTAGLASAMLLKRRN